MSLIFVFGVWLLLGGFVYRAHKQSGSTAEPRHADQVNVPVGLDEIPAEIPDTVPSEWVETYRAEHGGW